MPLLIILLLLSFGCASTQTNEWTVERKNRADRANELGRAVRANAERGYISHAPQMVLPPEPLMFSCTSYQTGPFTNTDCF